jgi:hypothetical protein
VVVLGLSATRKGLLMACLAATIAAGAAGIASVVSGLADSDAPTLFPAGAATRGSVVFAVENRDGVPRAIAPATPSEIVLDVAASVGILGLCILAVVLVIRLLRGRPFSPSLARGTAVLGVLLVAGGVVTGILVPSSGLAPAVVVVGLFLLFVGLAFEHGANLSADTEGLV